MRGLIRFMKKNYKIILATLLLCAGLWSFKAFKKEDTEKDKVLIELLVFVLKQAHYNAVPVDDEFSKAMFDTYLENMDPYKRYFLESDINEFSKYKLALDDLMLSSDLSFFDLTYNRLNKRIKESESIYKEILDKPVDFDIEEIINTNYDSIGYAKTPAELKDRWRQQLKHSLASSIYTTQKIEEDKVKKDSTYVAKTFVEIEKDAREKSAKNLNDFYEIISELERKDWFSVYINSFTENFDPHSQYFAPNDKERFDSSISGTLEGIGARLQKKNDYVELNELIPGGPAWKNKEIEQGDIIIKVAQANEEPIDIGGMRLDDVVSKIKGKKGTEVRLTVRKVDGTIKEISIIRDIVELEDTYAKSSIINLNDEKYGIIHLPKFYINFEDANARDAYKDVALEVQRLKEAGVDGIVMDLRNNGGGSLQTVVEMVGLFIEQGPVVQVKGSGKSKQVLTDDNPATTWDKPLVVLVNQFSASASEIFAAAIQDYNRGIVMGSKHTFGKGTVQNMIDLNSLMRRNTFGDMGALKTTIQKFYRVNGGSTQIKGVESDIILPDRMSYIDTGERDMKKALPWDKIEPANYKPLANDFSGIIEASNERVKANPQFILIDENAQLIKERQSDDFENLQYTAYKTKQQDNEKKISRFKEINNYDNNLKFTSLPYEVEMLAIDTTYKSRIEDWHKQLKKDVYVEEAVNVLHDLATQKTQPKNTAATKPKKFLGIF
ncbi:carboxy terminal-processing peptidase [Flavobacterium agricola]|uniref:Carboxy terminal-processing peptidase n=1 Tax=Flavobacterium agricola TaxID=2870839 RepID=A0ABY6M0I5_9FLAO|nr:carboxy terminal-processing peptidase [Flavobacterium agricola]UYW01332.1 carboxy terminal-processing peptidase [Flavobacterium agricola]